MAGLAADDRDRGWSSPINRADAELHKAKSLGRDRFSAWQAAVIAGHSAGLGLDSEYRTMN